MCGIVGMLTGATNGFTHKEMEVFQELLYCDALRGPDSTGLFSVSNKGNVKWAKAALLPSAFVAREPARIVLSNALNRGSALIGHNRKATQGKINTENAHPFQEGHTILIHNGTLRNHWKLMSQGKKDTKNIAVDSHIVTYLFEHDDWKKTLNEIDGAYTFVWYNAQEQKLRIIRNHERPLAWVVNKETDTMFFASEMGMLYWILQRNGQMPKDKYVSGYFKEKQLYEYALVDGGGWESSFSNPFNPPPLKQEETKPAPRQVPVLVETKPKTTGAKVVHVNHAPLQLPSSQAGIPEKFRANFRGYETIDTATIDPYERIMFQVTEYAPHSNGAVNAWRFQGEEINTNNTPHSIRGTFIGDKETLEKARAVSLTKRCLCGFVKSVVEDQEGKYIIAVCSVEPVDHPIEYGDCMLIHPDLHREYMNDEKMCNCWKETKSFTHLLHENLWYLCTKCDDVEVVDDDEDSDNPLDKKVSGI